MKHLPVNPAQYAFNGVSCTEGYHFAALEIVSYIQCFDA